MTYIFDSVNHILEFNNGHKLTYKIVTSSRAKRIILKVRPTAELDFVIPKGLHFSKKDMLKILESKACWIEDAFTRLKERCKNLNVPVTLPQKIMLPALGESWIVKTRDMEVGAAKDVCANIKKYVEPISAEKQLIISKNTDDIFILSKTLQGWLHQYSKEYLSAQAYKIAGLHDFRINKVSVKAQRTKWGSCSSRGNINLNYRLILLDERLSDYLILHELCHLKHMNHSALYKNFIHSLEPNSKIFEKELDVAWRKLPNWILV